MTHEILEILYKQIIEGFDPQFLEMNIEQYKLLKEDLEMEEDFSTFVDLTIVIKNITRIHVR